MFDTKQMIIGATISAAVIAACAASVPRGINRGMVPGAQEFPVVVADFETTPTFSWAGGAARSLVVTEAMANQTAEEREANAAVWDAYAGAGGFSSPVTLNTVPAGATNRTGATAGLVGGQYYIVTVELSDGRRGSQKFVPPMPKAAAIGALPATACKPESQPAAHHGHCLYPFADKGNLCNHYTGSAGANVATTKHDCEVLLKGTYGDGPCPDSTAGQCLSRCGAPNESLDTVYFATPDEWKNACKARNGTYTAP